jgi:hypothetical protein
MTSQSISTTYIFKFSETVDESKFRNMLITTFNETISCDQLSALKLFFNGVHHTDRHLNLREGISMSFNEIFNFLSDKFPNLNLEIIISPHLINFDNEQSIIWNDDCITCTKIQTYEDYSEYETLPPFFPVHFDGFLIKKDKNSFKGTWEHHKIKKGTLYRNNNKMMGEFKDFELEGLGYLLEVSGNEHLGNFIKGQLNGFGCLSFSNGSYYRGTFVNGLLEGICTADCVSEFQEGEFHVNKMHGYSICDVQGWVLDGEFEMNSLNGIGIQIFIYVF